MTEKTTPQIRFCGVVHVTHVPDDLYRMMPPKIGSQRVRRETGRSRHHAIVFSITAPYCSSFPSPFVSVRCGANPLTARRVLALPIHRLSRLFFACHFRLISRRGPSVRIVSLSVQRPSTRCFSFPSRSFAGLTRGAVSAYMGRAVSPLWRPPPTRSGPCRCCAIGTGRAGHRSPATRARSPRPWGSSRGC